jgi:hypothetical protein
MAVAQTKLDNNDVVTARKRCLFIASPSFNFRVTGRKTNACTDHQFNAFRPSALVLLWWFVPPTTE